MKQWADSTNQIRILMSRNPFALALINLKFSDTAYKHLLADNKFYGV